MDCTSFTVTEDDMVDANILLSFGIGIVLLELSLFQYPWELIKKQLRRLCNETPRIYVHPIILNGSFDEVLMFCRV